MLLSSRVLEGTRLGGFTIRRCDLRMDFVDLGVDTYFFAEFWAMGGFISRTLLDCMLSMIMRHGRHCGRGVPVVNSVAFSFDLEV
jgi:hypothetical protein